MRFIHLVAHLLRGADRLWDDALAIRLWQALHRAFPHALGVTIMPDHVHLILIVRGVQAAVERFRAVLRGYAWGRGPTWEPVPPPRTLAGVAKLRTDLRYIALNPCRKHLVADPLEWPWSTHRDLVRATATPWVTGERLAPLLQHRASGFEASWHGYVSRDKDVAVAGTPLPVAVTPSAVVTHSLEEIALAAAGAYRSRPGAVCHKGPARDLALGLARRQGWPPGEPLARSLGISARASRRRPEPTREAWTAGALCLGDPRLTSWFRRTP